MSGLYRELGEKKQALLRMIQSAKTTAIASEILDDEAVSEKDESKSPKLHPEILDNHPVVCAVGKIMRELIIVTIGQGLLPEKDGIKTLLQSDIELSGQFIDDFRGLATVTDESGSLTILGKNIKGMLSQTILDVRVCLSLKDEEIGE